MKRVLGLVLALALAGAASAAPKVQGQLPPDSAATAQETASPESAVRALYAPYEKGGSIDMSVFQNNVERDRRLSADLVRALKAYEKAQASSDEPGALDFDPIMNGQDFGLEGLTVRTGTNVPGKSAEVTATFKNFGEPSQLTYRLVFEGNTWRVDNIISQKDPIWNLRDLLTAP
ncbi:MAG TPA: hypothetical protein DCL54_10830 [Alphaproteobacteria bacterium]|nr:hypothetical protein [Alphaproteobacteria bacterium]HAJ47063.1 hypothetical protein [Alphaproteobacteria bacterium]